MKIQTDVVVAEEDDFKIKRKIELSFWLSISIIKDENKKVLIESN